jgi:hypothetical protein
VNAGSLLVNGATAAGSAVSVADAAVLGGTGTVNGAVSLTGGATGATLTSSGTLTIANALTTSGNNNSVSAGIVGVTSATVGGQLSVAGGSTLNASGTATVNGLLSVSGTFGGAGAVSVTSGGVYTVNGTANKVTTVNGTLSGSGTVGAVTVNTGGLLSPGNSPGNLTVGGLTLASGSTMSMELNGLTVGTQYDRVTVTGGTPTLGNATLSLTSSGYTPGTSDKFFIVDNQTANSIGGTFAGLAQDSVATTIGGKQFKISYTGDTGTNAITGGNDVVLYQVAGNNTISLTSVAGATGANYADTTNSNQNPGASGTDSAVVHVTGSGTDYISEVDGLSSNQNSGHVNVDNDFSGNVPVYVMLWTDAALTSAIVPTNGVLISNGVVWDELQAHYGATGFAGANFNYLVQFTTNGLSGGSLAVNWNFAADSGVKLDRIAVVPEPGTFGLIGTAVMGLVSTRARRRRK